MSRGSNDGIGVVLLIIALMFYQGISSDREVAKTKPPEPAKPAVAEQTKPVRTTTIDYRIWVGSLYTGDHGNTPDFRTGSVEVSGDDLYYGSSGLPITKWGPPSTMIDHGSGILYVPVLKKEVSGLLRPANTDGYGILLLCIVNRIGPDHFTVEAILVPDKERERRAFGA